VAPAGLDLAEPEFSLTRPIAACPRADPDEARPATTGEKVDGN
jgi:hypothetical protein